MILTAQAISLIYQFWIHTERIGRLPAPLEFVFNTPSHHRVHHGSNEVYLDRNYGGILIIWDRLFGTFQRETERVRYGLTKNMRTFKPHRVAFHEFAAIARDVRGADELARAPRLHLPRPGLVAGRPRRRHARMKLLFVPFAILALVLFLLLLGAIGLAISMAVLAVLGRIWRLVMRR